MKLNGYEILSKRKARENTKYETFSQTFKIYAETIIVEDFILLGPMERHEFLSSNYLFIFISNLFIFNIFSCNLFVHWKLVKRI